MSGALATREAPDQLVDVWTERWSDPALRALGRWLVLDQFSDDVAMHAVARVWSFYSYAVVPVFAGYPPMALSARRAMGQTLV